MKLYDSKLELLAIRSICKSDKKLKRKLLASVNVDYFHSDVAREAIERIFVLVKKESDIPDYSSLTSDPVISESSRDILKKQRDYLSTEKDLVKTIKNLFKYKQARDLYFLSEKINETLTKDKVDVSKLIEETTKQVSKLKVKLSTKEEFFHFGESENSKSIIDRLLDDTPPLTVPTGFKAFDFINGGIAYGSLFTICGNSGSGKTSLAVQMAQNMALFGREDVVYIPLEMTELETSERIFANQAGIDLLKIKNKTLSDKEKKKIIKANKKFNTDLASDGTRFSIYAPDEGITMSQLLLNVKPFGYRVVIIDYAGLLEGMGGDSQWQLLGEAAREAKIWAKNNNAVVVFLAQSKDKEHALRYSQVIMDHSNNLWIWIANDETRENKIMAIKQLKARNQKMFDFNLSYDDDLYRVFDSDSQEFKNDTNEKDKNSNKEYLDTV